MINRKNSRQHYEQINPDKEHAQILIEVGSEPNIIEKARQIIEGLGVHVIEIENVLPQLVLFKLDVKDMREAVLRLTENGFFNIEGYNALEM